jgi:glycosyltransferase involved in cell wall biosynthesis
MKICVAFNEGEIMNVLFLSELFYPHGGGAEYATFLYSRLLSQAGFNVRVITHSFNGEPRFSKDGRLTVYRFPLLGESGSVKYAILKRFDFLFSDFMNRMIKWADVVYIPRFWFSAIPLAKALGKPVVAHLHDYIPICSLAVLYNMSTAKVCNGKRLLCPPRCIYVYEKARNRKFREALTSTILNSIVGQYISRLIELSDAVICASKFQKDIIEKQKLSLRTRLYVIYNPLPRLSIIGMEGNDFGYFGGPDVMKGFCILSKALLEFKRHNSISIRVHSTKFPSEYGKCASALGKLGFIFYSKLKSDELENVYKKICAVIVPSIWPEPWPYVVVEALINGRLLLASKVGGIPEQVYGCKGVHLFDAGDYAKLAELIEYVNSLGREDVIDLGLHNRENFLQRFDNEISIKNFVSVIESIV